MGNGEESIHAKRQPRTFFFKAPCQYNNHTKPRFYSVCPLNSRVLFPNTGMGRAFSLLYFPVYSRKRKWGPGSRLVRGASRRAAPGFVGSKGRCTMEGNPPFRRAPCFDACRDGRGARRAGDHIRLLGDAQAENKTRSTSQQWIFGPFPYSAQCPDPMIMIAVVS